MEEGFRNNPVYASNRLCGSSVSEFRLCMGLGLSEPFNEHLKEPLKEPSKEPL